MLSYTTAVDVWNKLTTHADATIINDLIKISNTAYKKSSRIETKEAEWANYDIDVDNLADKIKQDLKEGLKDLNTRGILSCKLNQDIIDAGGDLAAEVTKSCFSKEGHFIGNGHHVRQQISMNVALKIAAELNIE